MNKPSYLNHGYSGDRVKESEIIETAWKNILELTKADPAVSENRRKLAMACKGLEAYLINYILENEQYVELIDNIHKREPKGMNEYVTQIMDFMKALKIAQTKSKVQPPKSVSYEVKFGQPTDCPVIQDSISMLRDKATTMLALFVGKVGTGKSSSASTFASVVDSPWSLGRVFFETEEFFHCINTFKDRAGDDLKATNVLMWEELSIQADNRQFMSLKNRVISQSLDTWRSKNLGLCLTLPSMDSLDSRISNRVDWIFEVKQAVKKNRKLIKIVCDVKVSQHNPVIKKTYKKHPIYTIDGEDVMVNTITFYPPPENYFKAYNKLSDEYKNKINVELEKKLVESKKKSKVFDMEEAIKEVKKNKEVMAAVTNRGTLNWKMIKRVLGCTFAEAQEVRDVIGDVREKNV
jgi:hypothetical protein